MGRKVNSPLFTNHGTKKSHAHNRLILTAKSLRRTTIVWKIDPGCDARGLIATGRIQRKSENSAFVTEA